MKQLKIIITVAFIFSLLGCTSRLSDKKLYNRIKKSVIYEVNVRDYTPQGTFKAFEKHLPQLKRLGVDILWIMPVQPIGVKNRKGTLGSPYSVRDYYKINPLLGTEDDFKHLVQQAHKLGMLVILDWVANHTAWDNPWIKQHPQWYTHDENGKIIPPNPEWTDVADLNYQNPQLRHAMVDAMKYWLKKYDLDGFRCDAANLVPVSFWDSARTELEKIKPVFMLAEAEDPGLNCKAFDAYYGWDLYHRMNDVAAGKANALALKAAIKRERDRFPKHAMRMIFTSNHDENSWFGSVFERMPNSYKTFAVFTFVVPDLPLIYNGQEACMHKRLKFFDKDTIPWKQCDMFALYQKLIALKHSHSALYGGVERGKMRFVQNTQPQKVLAVYRFNKNDHILSVFNFSNDTVTFRFKRPFIKGSYTEYFTGNVYKIDTSVQITMLPWKYLVLIKNHSKN